MQKQSISKLELTVESLREDNVKLYEKIRFLQLYPSTVSDWKGRCLYIF